MKIQTSTHVKLLFFTLASVGMSLLLLIMHFSSEYRCGLIYETYGRVGRRGLNYVYRVENICKDTSNSLIISSELSKKIISDSGKFMHIYQFNQLPKPRVGNTDFRQSDDFSAYILNLKMHHWIQPIFESKFPDMDDFAINNGSINSETSIKIKKFHGIAHVLSLSVFGVFILLWPLQFFIVMFFVFFEIAYIQLTYFVGKTPINKNLKPVIFDALLSWSFILMMIMVAVFYPNLSIFFLAIFYSISRTIVCISRCFRSSCGPATPIPAS